MHTLGTAGHVDHGKSALVQALTGIDPDRLAEEKARGLTIELGFAWLALPSGRQVSIVDVPGHERFIKNMLAGAGGVDLALLVVAADEGTMPQTREHLAILELLGVERGIVVITKCDLVDEEMLELLDAEMDDVLAGGPFASVPRIRTSAFAGTGISELLAAIDSALDATRERPDRGRPRLAVDRVFSSRGFGTVVTGTLVDGSLHVGQEVEIQPGGRRARIRGLQRHTERVERLGPGTRAAINLSGVEKADVARGDVVAPPGTVPVARAVDVHLVAPALLSHPITHNLGVTFLTGSGETEAKLRLLEGDSVEPGEETWAQVVFARPLPLRAGDRYVVRSPNETLGGGTIVALDPRRHRRNDAATIERLARQLAGTPEDRVLDRLATGPATVAELDALVPAATDIVAALAEAGLVVRAAPLIASQPWLAAQGERLGAVLSSYFAEHPLRAEVPAEHVRTTLKLDRAVWGMVLAAAVDAGLVAPGRSHTLTIPGRTVVLTGPLESAATAWLAALREGGLAPPTDMPIDPELLAYLVWRGDVVQAGGLSFASEAYADARERVVRQLRAQESITLAEVRDLLGTSRRYVQALLEQFDSDRVTRRVGDARVLRTREDGT